MAKPLNHIIPAVEHEEDRGPVTEGLPAIVAGLLVLVVWIASFAIFGYAGLIVPALLLVAAIMVSLVIVSRG